MKKTWLITSLVVNILLLVGIGVVFSSSALRSAVTDYLSMNYQTIFSQDRNSMDLDQYDQQSQILEIAPSKAYHLDKEALLHYTNRELLKSGSGFTLSHTDGESFLPHHFVFFKEALEDQSLPVAYTTVMGEDKAECIHFAKDYMPKNLWEDNCQKVILNSYGALYKQQQELFVRLSDGEAKSLNVEIF